jgi:hypothetical protein
MNIEKATLSKRNRLSVTVTLSGVELAWLQYLAAQELERGETVAFSYGSDMATASELRSMTERLDPHYVELCVHAEREGWNLDADQLLAIVKKQRAAVAAKRETVTG